MLDTGCKRKCRVKEDPRLLLNGCERAQVDQSRRERTAEITGWLLSNWFTEDFIFIFILLFGIMQETCVTSVI